MIKSCFNSLFAARGDEIPVHLRCHGHAYLKSPLLKGMQSPILVRNHCCLISWNRARKSETKKISKRATRVWQIRQTDERQHDESEKRVITGHMITTRYISTCKNPCTLHSFVVHLPPISIIPIPCFVGGHEA